MGIVVAFLMIMSGFGIYLQGKGAQSNVVEDYGHRFSVSQDANYFTTALGGGDVAVYYLPSTVAPIEVPSAVGPLLRDAQGVIYTFDPDVSSLNLQAIDLVRFDLSYILRKPTINAVISPSLQYQQLPVLGCENATAQLPVIAIGVAKDPAISLDGSCVRLVGNVSGLLEVRDRLVYEYFGVYS